MSEPRFREFGAIAQGSRNRFGLLYRARSLKDDSEWLVQELDQRLAANHAARHELERVLRQAAARSSASFVEVQGSADPERCWFAWKTGGGVSLRWLLEQQDLEPLKKVATFRHVFEALARLMAATRPTESQPFVSLDPSHVWLRGASENEWLQALARPAAAEPPCDPALLPVCLDSIFPELHEPETHARRREWLLKPLGFRYASLLYQMLGGESAPDGTPLGDRSLSMGEHSGSVSGLFRTWFSHTIEAPDPVKVYERVRDACLAPERPALKGYTVEADRVVLSWDPVPGAVTFFVERAAGKQRPFERLAVIGAEVSSFEDDKALPGESYYRLRAQNKVGSSEGPILAVRVGSPPERPALKLSTAEPGRVTLSWDAVAGAATFILERAAGKERRFELLTVVDAEILTFTDDKPLPGDSSYRLRAQNKVGSSEASEVSYVGASPAAPPPPADPPPTPKVELPKQPEPEKGKQPEPAKPPEKKQEKEPEKKAEPKPEPKPPAPPRRARKRSGVLGVVAVGLCVAGAGAAALKFIPGSARPPGKNGNTPVRPGAETPRPVLPTTSPVTPTPAGATRPAVPVPSTVATEFQDRLTATEAPEALDALWKEIESAPGLSAAEKSRLLAAVAAKLEPALKAAIAAVTARAELPRLEGLVANASLAPAAKAALQDQLADADVAITGGEIKNQNTLALTAADLAAIERLAQLVEKILAKGNTLSPKARAAIGDGLPLVRASQMVAQYTQSGPAPRAKTAMRYLELALRLGAREAPALIAELCRFYGLGDAAFRKRYYDAGVAKGDPRAMVYYCLDENFQLLFGGQQTGGLSVAEYNALLSRAEAALARETPPDRVALYGAIYYARYAALDEAARDPNAPATRSALQQLQTGATASRILNVWSRLKASITNVPEALDYEKIRGGVAAVGEMPGAPSVAP